MKDEQEFRETVLIKLTALECSLADLHGHLTPEFFADVQTAKATSRVAYDTSSSSRTLLYSVILGLIVTAVPSFYLLAKELSR